MKRVKQEKASKAPPRTLLGRGTRLLGLAAKLGQQEIGRRVDSLVSSNAKISQLKNQVEQAQLLVKTLGHLKGAAMKVGQALSVELRDFFPSDVIDVLNQLQDNSDSMGIHAVEKILKQELGPEKFLEIKDLSAKPLASASIGQVHGAVYKEEKIAIKIQYPGIDQTIDTDLSLLQSLFRGLIKISGRQADLDPLFVELKNVLKQEADYTQEAALHKEYAVAFANLTQIRIPRVIDELSTKHVIAMSLEEGLKPDAWMKTNPSAEQRNKVARMFLDLYSHEFFKSGLVQTDPNFANFLIHPNAEYLVALDFGATRRYSQEFRTQYQQLLRTIAEGTTCDIISDASKMGLIDLKESEDCREAFAQMLRMSIEPFHKDRQPFCFSDTDYANKMRNTGKEFLRLSKHTPPPHQLIFLHRKLGGTFHLLKTIKAEVDLTPYWEEFT